MVKVKNTKCETDYCIVNSRMIFCSSGKSEGEIHLWDRGKRPFEASFIDNDGPLRNATLGYKHVFLIIDGSTKFVVFYLVKSTSAKETISKLGNYIHHYGKSRIENCSVGKLEYQNFISRRNYDIFLFKVLIQFTATEFLVINFSMVSSS